MEISKRLESMFGAESVLARSQGTGLKDWLKDWQRFSDFFNDVSGWENRNDLSYEMVIVENGSTKELYMVMVVKNKP